MAAKDLIRPFVNTPIDIVLASTKYTLIEKVDNGSFGQVYRAQLWQQPRKVVAIKLMDKERIHSHDHSESVANEIALHWHLDTSNTDWLYRDCGIVRLLHAKRDVEIGGRLYDCLVLEFCEGPHLHDYLETHHSAVRLNEVAAFYFFEQIIQNIECLHKQHIIHRDIKPQNLLLSSTQCLLPVLKLCDFGLAKKLSPDAQYTTQSLCGTPNYISPEIVRREGHDYSTDVWSAACVLYVMLDCSHKAPFETGDVKETLERVKQGKFQYPRGLSEECTSFLASVFEPDQEQRITIQEIKRHPWWTRNKRRLQRLLSVPLKPIVSQYLMPFDVILSRTRMRYSVHDGFVSLQWGVNLDNRMRVTPDQRVQMSFMGTKTNIYDLGALPVGIRIYYLALYRFVKCHERYSPLVVVSLCENKTETKNKPAVYKHHLMTLTKSQNISYQCRDQKQNIKIAYDMMERSMCDAYVKEHTPRRSEPPLDETDLSRIRRIFKKLFRDMVAKYPDIDYTDKDFPFIFKLSSST